LLGGTDGMALNATIVRNKMHECGNPIYDNKDHCIYVAHTEGGVIRNNLLYNCAAYAIQFYPDSQGMLYEYNTSDGGPISVRGGIVFGGESAPVSNNNTIRNNIITYAAVNGISGSWGGPYGTGNTANNNCLWQASVSERGFTASGNITADPMFVDRANRNYTLRAGSPCAGKGAF
jgi:hypothetical protein